TGGLYIKTQDVNSETAYIGGIISSCASIDEGSSVFTSELSYISINAPLTIESKQVTNYVGGIAGFAKDIVMKNVTISSGYNIVIDVPKANSVGGIIGHYEGTLDYDTEKCIFNIGSVKINAVSYIGAYIGYINGSLNILKDINIEGTDLSYVEIIGNSSSGNIGGVFGYVAENVVLDSSITLSYININKSNENYVSIYYGGIFGNIAGTLSMGENSYIDISYMNLYGNSYVGAITGKVSLFEDNENIYRIKISDTLVSGTSNYIGGVFGYVNTSVNLCGNIDTYKTKVNGNYYVGGIFGYVNGNVTVNNNITNSLGNVTGYSNVSAVFGYLINTSLLVVSASSNIKVAESVMVSEISVGGLVYSAGFVYIAGSFTLERSKLETKTTYSDSGTAGGVVGIIHRTLIITGKINISGTDAYHNTIKGYKYAGGLVGYINFGNSNYVENISIGVPNVDTINDALYADTGLYVYGGDIDIKYTDIVANQNAGGVVGQTNGNLHFVASSDLLIEHSTVSVDDSAMSGISSYAGGIIGVKYNSRIFVYSSTVNILMTEGDIQGQFIGFVIGYDYRYSIYAVSLHTVTSVFIVGPGVSPEYYYGEVSNNR
ncbi:MAG: hypothetical protein IJW28_02305, partial [Clostridia bacterium]|nr:hypothetical protein [Clostridia bacterium]